MSVHQCPFCRHLNAATALRCAACSADLTGTHPAPPRQRLASAGAIWLDDLAAAGAPPAGSAPAGSEPPAPAAQDAARVAQAADPDADFTITLRDVAARPTRPAPLTPARARSAPAASPASWPAASPADAPFLPFGNAAATPPDPARGADKSAHRAAVRLERLRAPGVRKAPAPAVSNVLVVDGDPGAREALTALLRGFGFTVHPQADVATAAAWANRRPQLTAVFMDLPTDPARAEATLALCKAIRGRDRPAEGGALPTVLVLVAAQLRPVDRVRAELAGCDATIAKPVTRGSVAGVLDARGVTLPADARRR